MFDHEIIGKSSKKKIGRDAFLYMENPSTSKFAQCGTCWLFDKDNERCAILGQRFEVKAEDTCGAYLEGSKQKELKVRAIATPEEVGFLKGTSVRCDNCKYGGPECGLYKMLNDLMSDDFDLDTAIDARGCCNAFISAG